MVTYIIRTKNEERWIGHCIQSIIDNSRNYEYEIKLIDNESSDNTLSIVKMFKNDCRISVLTIKKTEYTPGKALNMCLEKCSTHSKFACIISAHCVVKDIDFKNLYNHFKDDKCCGVIGRQIPVHKGKKIKSKYVWENFKDNDENLVIKNLKENIAEGNLFFHNAFSFINLKVWKEYKFDENLTGKEDREWITKLSSLNYYSVYDSRSICYHHWTGNCATWSGLG